MNCSVKTPLSAIETKSDVLSIFAISIKTFVWIICIFCIIPMIIPLAPKILGNEELDASWCSKCVRSGAQIHHLVFGREIIWTYGPWGFVDADFYNPSTFVPLVITRLLICLAIIIGWSAVSRRMDFSHKLFLP